MKLPESVTGALGQPASKVKSIYTNRMEPQVLARLEDHTTWPTSQPTSLETSITVLRKPSMCHIQLSIGGTELQSEVTVQ